MTKEQKIRKQVYDFLSPLGIEAKVSKEPHGIAIEPRTMTFGKNRKDFFDGMRIMCWSDGSFEVAEYAAGKEENELWIYKNTKTLKSALMELLKGNKRKPIKVWK